MKIPLKILKCENGFLVVEDDYGQHSQYYPLMRWVAKDEEELGKLIERLAKQEVNSVSK